MLFKQIPRLQSNTFQTSAGDMDISTSSQYTLAMLQDEVYQLLQQKVISRQQPISVLAGYFSARDWKWMEQELEQNDFLLRDPIGELISHEEWYTD